jgi:hypothetical protein
MAKLWPTWDFPLPRPHLPNFFCAILDSASAF